jgi:hypothetical protein
VYPKDTDLARQRIQKYIYKQLTKLYDVYIKVRRANTMARVNTAPRSVAGILKNIVAHGSNWSTGDVEVWGVMSCADFELRIPTGDGTVETFTVRILPEGVK